MVKSPPDRKVAKRIGEILLERGFITEQQLKDALSIAKKKKIRVGEALFSMGVLNKDHVYWVLGSQLDMDYVELSHEIVDKDLVTQFPIEDLLQFMCLPLYEDSEEIHFVISDPTNAEIVKKISNLKRGKTVRLHLALPDKIGDVLDSIRTEAYTQLQKKKMANPLQKYFEQSPAKTVEVFESADTESYWNDLVTHLLAMPKDKKYWFYKTPYECRLISQEGKKFETIRRYPVEIYDLINERRQRKAIPASFQPEALMYLRDDSTGQEGAFKIGQIDSLDGHMIWFQRIPTFSQEQFLQSYPKAPVVIEHLASLFYEHSSFIVGGEDTLFVKQCFYSLLSSGNYKYDFPYAFFIEGEIENYFPSVVQVARWGFDIVRFLEQFEEEGSPFIFYETEFSGLSHEEKGVSEILSGRWKNIILYLSSTSIGEMKKSLSLSNNWRKSGFKAVFFSTDELTAI